MIVERVNAILGLTGSGKSRLMRRLFLTAAREGGGLGGLVLAPKGDFGDVAHAVGRAGFIRALRGAARIMPRFPRSRMTWQTISLDDLSFAAECCWARRDVLFVVDDATAYITNSRSRLPEALRLMVKMGRPFGQRVILNAQRPTDISQDLLTEACIWVFPCSGSRDRRHIEMATARGGVPGIDPATLRVLRREDRRIDGVMRPAIIETQVARVDADGPDILTFNLETGKLSKKKTRTR